MAKYYRELNPAPLGVIDSGSITTVVEDTSSNETYRISLGNIGPKIVPAAYSRLMAYSLTPQTITAQVSTTLYLELTSSPGYSVGGEYTVVPPDDCYFVPNEDGFYLVAAQVLWTGTWAVGVTRQLSLVGDTATDVIRNAHNSAVTATISQTDLLVGVVYLVTTDTYRLKVNWGGTGTKEVGAGMRDTRLNIVRMV